MIERKHTFNPVSDRYVFDFRRCTYEKGFAQVDTRQDASWFGQWTNPWDRIVVQFAEGDITRTYCETDEEYAAEIRSMAQWNMDNDYWIGIDAGLGEEFKERFEELGLSEFVQ